MFASGTGRETVPWGLLVYAGCGERGRSADGGTHLPRGPLSLPSLLRPALVVAEIAATRITERGETRADDRVTEAAMEDRKREGYF